MATKPEDTPITNQSKAEGRTVDRPEQTADAPRTDTGWAWVVLVAAFPVYFTALGFSSSLSVYLPVWVAYFEASAATTGLVMSIGVLMRGILSPLSSALCTRFGPRVVTIVGGVITVGGAVVSSRSPTIEFLIFTNSCITALGVSMVFVAAMHVLGMYFKKRYTLAVGIALAGISCGQLAFPPLITYLIDSYGWRGSVLVEAAFILHIVAAGALMRPIVRKKQKVQQRKGVDSQTSGQDHVNMNENVSQVESGVCVAHDEITEPGGNREGNFSGEFNEQRDYRDVTVIIADNSSDSAELITEGNVRPSETTVNPFVVTIAEDGLDHLNLPESLIDDKPDSVCGYLILSLSRFKHFLLDTYGLRRLVRNARFILMLFVAFTHGFGKLGILYIVARAKSVGVDLNSSALLLSMFGTGGLIGRIGPGWFIDKKYITVEMAYALALLVFCVAVTLMPVFVVFSPLAVLAVLMGAAAGTSGSLALVIVRSLVHQSDASEALGILLIFMSIGTLTGTLASGLVYDNTASYDIAFYTGGVTLLAASLLAAVLYFLQKAKRKRHLLVAKFWAKFPRKTNVESQLKPVGSVFGQPDPALGVFRREDLGIVNPVYTSTDTAEVLTNGVVVKDKSCQEADDHHEKKKPFVWRRFGRKSEVGKMEGIENPVPVDHGSVDNTTGEKRRSRVDEDQNIPGKSAGLDPESNGLVSPDNSPNLGTSGYFPECHDKSLRTSVANQESHCSSPSATDVTLTSTSSLVKNTIENPVFGAGNAEAVSRDDDEPMPDGNIDFAIENSGYDCGITESVDSHGRGFDYNNHSNAAIKAWTLEQFDLSHQNVVKVAGNDNGDVTDPVYESVC